MSANEDRVAAATDRLGRLLPRWQWTAHDIHVGDSTTWVGTSDDLPSAMIWGSWVHDSPFVEAGKLVWRVKVHGQTYDYSDFIARSHFIVRKYETCGCRECEDERGRPGR